MVISLLSVYEVRDAVLHSLSDCMDTSLLVQKIEKTAYEERESITILIKILVTLDSVQQLTLKISDDSIEISCGCKWHHRSSMHADDPEHYESQEHMQAVWLDEIAEKIKAVFLNSLRLDYVTRGGFPSCIRAHYIPLGCTEWVHLDTSFYWHSPLLAIFPNRKVRTEVISFQQR